MTCGENPDSRGRALHNLGIKHLNCFYETADSSELLLAKENVEKADKFDPRGRNSRLTYKFSILFLLKNYKDGITLVLGVMIVLYLKVIIV